MKPELKVNNYVPFNPLRTRRLFGIEIFFFLFFHVQTALTQPILVVWSWFWSQSMRNLTYMSNMPLYLDQIMRHCKAVRWFVEHGIFGSNMAYGPQRVKYISIRIAGIFVLRRTPTIFVFLRKSYRTKVLTIYCIKSQNKFYFLRSILPATGK